MSESKDRWLKTNRKKRENRILKLSDTSLKRVITNIFQGNGLKDRELY